MGRIPHFADKREVFFEGEVALISMLVEGVHETPDDAAPMEMLLHAFSSVAALVEANRPFLEPRKKVIEAVPALRERACEISRSDLSALCSTGRARRRACPRNARSSDGDRGIRLCGQHVA